MKPVRSGYADVNGIKLHHESSGAGKAIACSPARSNSLPKRAKPFANLDIEKAVLENPVGQRVTDFAGVRDVERGVSRSEFPNRSAMKSPPRIRLWPRPWHRPHRWSRFRQPATSHAARESRPAAER